MKKLLTIAFVLWIGLLYSGCTSIPGEEDGGWQDTPGRHLIDPDDR